MNHEAEQLLGAYALGALDPEERAELELHLETCADCRRRLAEYRQVAEGLLHAAGAHPPSTELRERVVAAIGTPAADRERGEPGTEQAAEPAPAAPITGKQADPGRIGTGWRGWLRRPQAALTGLAALLVAANLYLLGQVIMLSDRSEQLLAQQRINQTALAIMSYPNSRVANLEQESVRGSFIYDDGLELAVLNVWGLPRLEQDQAYQLWLIQEDGSRASGGLLTPGDESEFVSLVVWSPVRLEAIQGIGITIESAEGSQSPTGPRVIGTDLVHSP